MLHIDQRRKCLALNVTSLNKKDGYRQLNVRQLGSLRPVTIPVNVTWIEREFNACQTPRSMSMYPSIFNHFRDVAVYRWRVTGFQQYSWANERF